MPKKKAAKKKIPAPTWPDPGFISQYSELTPDTQTVAIALAVYAEPFHRSELMQVLHETGARDIARRTFSAIRAREAIKKLVDVGWLEEEFEDLFLIEPIINPLLEVAARNERLLPLASNYLRQQTTPGIGRVATHELLKHARLTFFLRDWQRLESLEFDENRDRKSVV